MILAQKYLGRNGNAFEAYMALQRALMRRFAASGGTLEAWCEKMAPAFQKRYAFLLRGRSCPADRPARPAAAEARLDGSGEPPIRLDGNGRPAHLDAVEPLERPAFQAGDHNPRRDRESRPP